MSFPGGYLTSRYLVGLFVICLFSGLLWLFFCVCVCGGQLWMDKVSCVCQPDRPPFRNEKKYEPHRARQRYSQHVYAYAYNLSS